MKVTVVPAQITTIEDRIVGSLGMSQLVLLTLPVVLGGGMYIVLPPTMHAAPYKLTLIVLLAAVCAVMAIRIRGRILLLWLVTILRYNLRPRYFVFDKRSQRGREQYLHVAEHVPQEEKETKVRKKLKELRLSTAEIVQVERLLADPTANVFYSTDKKGKLYVRITEVKQES
jgi:Ca2+/Na+ antiporter